MKNNWPVKKLGDVANILMGQSPPSSTYNFNQVGLPFYQGKAEFGVKFPLPNKYCSAPIRIAQAGDILISVRAPVGPINIAQEESCIGRGLCAIQAIKNIATQNYLYFILKQHEDNWIGSTGSTFQSINRRNISDFQIPVPPLEIQKKIVERLDAIKKAQELNDLQISKTDELYKSILNSFFSSENEKKYGTSRLGEYFDITSSKRVFRSEWKKEGVPFYRAREIVKLSENGTVDNDLFITESMYSEYAKKYGIPKPGDIMVTGVGTLGICYLVKEGDRFYFKDGNIIWLKNMALINSEFVKHAFDSDYFKKQILTDVGATVGTYTIINAKNTKIIVPPPPEQQDIATKLNAIQDYKKLLLRQKELLQELFGSVLNKSMTGEMDESK